MNYIRNQFFLVLLSSLVVLKLTACVSIPDGAVAVQPFNQTKYLGKWYEIARMDFKFEKNLNNVTATYSLKDNGDIKVDNRGFDYINKAWKESIGNAKFVGPHDVARLKVSFFGPFYAGYNVIAIDEKYQYALIAGNNLNYLWVLSREKTVPSNIRLAYLQKAEGLGYAINNLVWTRQDK